VDRVPEPLAERFEPRGLKGGLRGGVFGCGGQTRDGGDIFGAGAAGILVRSPEGGWLDRNSR
jgi:hypothetical protein